jgi:hypothetical protein
MESTIQIRYQDLSEPKQVWDRIIAEFEKVINLNGCYKMPTLTSCQFESYPAVTAYISANDMRINDLALRGIIIEGSWRKFYMMSTLPNTAE